jgi:hypothetical protein
VTWGTIDDKKYTHAFREIEKQTHRGVALIATAILQDHLDLAIRTKLVDDKQVQNKLFSIGGRLNDFGTQIDLGYLLGLYPKSVHQRLLIVRDIRNDFAHKMDPMSFSFHKDRCRRLKTTRRFHRDWNAGLNRVLKTLGASEEFEMTMSKPSTNPKRQFVRFIQIATWLLTLQISLIRFEAAQATSPDK